uniref:EGF-like domain-containing protein n=1 Tax=Nothobranchius furzeri TaxID=105023 RepID=A0A1A8AZ45_NOTFU
MHTFMGTCTYTLVEVCNTSQVTYFKVVAKNEERGQPEASYVRSVKVYLPHDTELNEKFVSEDCSQTCECTSTGSVCHPKTCQDGYICTIYDFKRDCYKASACLDYPCLNGGTCVDSRDHNYTCICKEGFEGVNCEVEATPKKGLDTKWIILIAVLVPVAVIALVMTIVCVCRHKNKKYKHKEGNLTLQQTNVPYESIRDKQQRQRQTRM